MEPKFVESKANKVASVLMSHTQQTFRIIVRIVVEEFQKSGNDLPMKQARGASEDDQYLIAQKLESRLRAEHPEILRAPQSIDTVDFDTILAALTVAGRRGADETRSIGIEPAGRPF